MEEKVGMIYDRINKVENDLKDTNREIRKLNDKVDINDNKHDERYLQMSISNTKMEAHTKSIDESMTRLSNNINNYLEDSKQRSEITDKKFDIVHDELNNINTKIDEKKTGLDIQIEEKRLSNKTVGAIIGGSFIVIQTAIQFIAPLFFN